MKILIGSSNQAKIDAYKKLLSEYDFEIVSSKDLNIPEPAEVATTFEEEAIEKAKYYHEKSNLAAFVDDGGFQVPALKNEPGTKSRRWTGHDMTDEEIINEVMKRMEGEKNRACKHVVVLAIATPFGVFTAHGNVEGVVPEKPSPKRVPGFPYLSVVYFPEHKKYWIDLYAENEAFNPRRIAFDKIKDVLKDLEN